MVRRHGAEHRSSRAIARPLALAAWAVAVLLAVGGRPATAQTASGKPLKVAFFGFDLINTSLEPPRDAERQRIAMVGEDLRRMLMDSGRYQFVPLSDELKQKIAHSAEITGCNGCQIDWARQAGADLAAWGTVQKVSNLILNLNVYIDDAKDGHQYFGRSVDIRGNTDESWQRGIRYLVRHYLLEEK
jgi:hypothetical protein